MRLWTKRYKPNYQSYTIWVQWTPKHPPRCLGMVTSKVGAGRLIKALQHPLRPYRYAKQGYRHAIKDRYEPICTLYNKQQAEDLIYILNEP